MQRQVGVWERYTGEGPRLMPLCVWSERELLLCRIMPQDRHDHVLSGGRGNDVLTAWLLLVVMSVKPFEALWLGECGVWCARADCCVARTRSEET